MWRTGYKSLLASSLLIGAMVVVSDGCSGDNGNGNTMSDAGLDEAVHPMPPMRRDGGLTDTGVGGDAAADGITFDVVAVGAGDMTTGKTCTMDSDCVAPGGPGINVCSIMGYFSGGPLDPTPVCLSPAPCDLGTGVNVMYCDGPSPTDSTSPGICLPTATAMSGPNGQCFPKCTIPPDGSAPTGCKGKDRCNLFATGSDMTGAPVALGYCLGGCSANSDCPTGSTCQKDEGLCVTTQNTATKQLGQLCTQNDLSPKNYRCNCFYQPTSMLGYCSQFCITGPNSPAPCPSGYVCDPQLPTKVTGQNDADVTGFTAVNPGLAGYCLQTCSTASAVDASNAGDATSSDAESEGGTDAGGGQTGGMCPVSAGCSTQDTAGPDCVP